MKKPLTLALALAVAIAHVPSPATADETVLHVDPRNGDDDSGGSARRPL